jgi:hypothetical protein
MRMETLRIDEIRALFVGVFCWLFPREKRFGQSHSVVEAQMERFEVWKWSYLLSVELDPMRHVDRHFV